MSDSRVRGRPAPYQSPPACQPALRPDGEDPAAPARGNEHFSIMNATQAREQGPGGLRKFCHENGLSLVMFGLFLLCWGGQIATGLHSHNEDLREHGQQTLSLGGYLSSGAFVEATFENWE